MRIISGEFGGLMIKMSKKLEYVRPTTDRSKSALFSTLEHHFDIEKLAVLDLFAGSGSVSLEFLSRAVEKLVSIDKSFHVIKHLEEQKKRFEIKNERWRIQKNDVFKQIKYENEKYDVVFADPPYDFPKIPDLIQACFLVKILKPNGLLIVEHKSMMKLNYLQNFIEERDYGQSAFSFFGD